MDELTSEEAVAPVPEQQQPSSVLGEPDEEDHDEDVVGGGSNFAEIFPPSAPALTLKEQLVHRERQRRIETERARWKHQFVLTNNNTTTQSLSSAQQEGTSEVMQDFSSNYLGAEDKDPVVDPLAVVVGQPRETRTNASTCSEDGEEQTLGGESTKAHPDEESNERLGFNMERFLRNSDSFNPQLEPMNEKEEEKPVLLERFLKDPVTVAATSGQDDPIQSNDMFLVTSEVHATSDIMTDAAAQRSVSFDMDRGAPQAVVASISDPVMNDMNTETPSVDVSLTVGHPSSETSFDQHHPTTASAQHPSGSVSDNTDEPRVLRLTEADMLEMASIDEASIGNAPPSDREEVMSEIGELADMTTEVVSQDTRSTALESNSALSSSLRSATQALPPASSANLASNYNTPAAEPPYETLANGAAGGYHTEEEEPLGLEPLIEANVARVAHSLSGNSLAAVDIDNTGVVNRQRAFSPYRQESPPLDPSAGSNVLGFDYDKDAPSSPVPEGGHDSYTELPPDLWTPRGKMHVSPLHPSSRPLVSSDILAGAAAAQFPAPLLSTGENLMGSPVASEKSPQKDIPPEIITRKGQEELPSSNGDLLASFLGRLFAQIESDANSMDQASEKHLQSQQLEQNVMFSSMFHLPSLVLLSFALPHLFNEVEQSRFFLLIAFATICCSQSRSILSQSTRHTLEAVRSKAVTSATFPRWCFSAVGTSIRPGLVGCVCMTGLVYLMSRLDVGISIVVLLAQSLSCLLAGIIGVLWPAGLLVSLSNLVPRRDWRLFATQANTAIHDVCFLVCWFSVSLGLLPAAGAAEELASCAAGT